MKRIHIYLTEAQTAELKRRQKETEVSITEQIRRLIDADLKKPKRAWTLPMPKEAK